MSKKRRERRKKKSRDGRRRAQKIDVLRGEKGREDVYLPPRWSRDPQLVAYWNKAEMSVEVSLNV